MGCKKKYWFLLPVVVSLVAHVAAVPLTDLFPFGLKFGDDSLPPGDDASATVTLQQQFPFYGKSRQSVTVHTDGRLDLRVDEYSTANIFSYSANVDTTNIGEVFYRETNDPFLLKKAAAMMLPTFPELSDATPTSLFIATWFYVGYFDGHSDKTNTFQCALATNGTVAFVTLLYVDGHMQWTASDSGSTVEVGFLDGSTYLFPPTDLTDIDTRSNAGSPGKWLFQVDGQSIITPDAGAVRSALEVEERDRRFVSGEGPTIDLQQGEVSIGFEQTTLSVEESELHIEVCVVIDASQLSGETNTIEFQLVTEDGTATAPDDYMGIDTVITVEVSNQQRVCRNITILEDKIFEYQEIFHVILCPLPDQNATLRFTITRLYIFIIDTTVFVEGCDFIRFIELNNPVTVPQMDLVQDGTSTQVEIVVRFPLGLPPNIVAEQPTFRIAENGVITFDGDTWSFFGPVLFPSTLMTIRDRYILAPFWADHDVQSSGSVEYQIFQCQFDSSDNETLFYVSIFIQKQFLDAAGFLGTWMLVVNWNLVPPLGDPTPTNTYQAIAITDGINSYAIYTYRCDLMEWGGGATVGFNAFGQTFGNHIASGRSTVHTDIACANLNGAHGVNYSNVFFHVGSSENPIQIERVRCLQIFKDDMRFPLLSSGDATECPCTFNQVIADENFQFFAVDEIDGQLILCFIPVFPVNTTLGVECCYNFPESTLVISGFRASSIQRFHPTFFLDQYTVYDLEFRRVCCGPAGLCDLFRMRRPQEFCDNYQPPFSASASGDPHFTTTDGRRYTFNGLGEYIVITASNPDFVLQGRTELSPGPEVTGGTQFSAFAFGLPSTSVVEVERPVGAADFVVRYNNADVAGNITDIDISITRTAEDTVLSVFPCGISVSVSVSGGIPNAVVALPQRFQGLIQGLLGNYNGDNTDDFIFRNGTMLSDDADDRMIFEFGQSWQITEDESLFNYPSGLSLRNFSFPDHEPQFTDEVVANADPAIVLACDNNTQCIFDATQTGNISVGLATLAFDQTTQMDQMVATNNPPLLQGDSPFTANADVEEVYRFSATDNDNFTVTVMDGVITNGVLEQNGTEFTFTFTIPSARDNFVGFSLGFSAVDSEGAMSSLQPQLLICACVNGNCTLDGVDDTGANTIVLNCICTEAYTGRFCDLDVDACALMPCFQGVNCTDIPAPGVGADCGPCPDGFREVQEKCLDIDECNQAVNPCDQVCVNTFGSFMCMCENGFMLEPDNRNCTDFDECMQALNPCDQICMNTVGSFMCMCENGFTLEPDNNTCTGPPCGASNPCSDRCADISGTEICLCSSGRMLLSDNITCEDINECLLSPPVCEETCTDTAGSFTCGCLSGFQLQSDGRSCSDIDECLVMGAAACAVVGQICVNTEGSFFCMCPAGTALVDGSCQVANIMFLETEITIAESDGFATVCLNISGGLPETAIVRLSTVASSATAGSDYVPIDNQAIVFMTSPDQVCVNICVINDMLVEETEQFHLTLTAPILGTNLVFSESRATVFLIDSSVVTIGFLAPSYTTDECASCSVVVRIGMSGSVLQTNVTFTLSTQDDTAIENDDYVPVSQMLQFGPMMPSEIEFEITILSDNITEEEEQFIALLESTDSSVILSTSSANITIVDTSVVTAEFEPCSYYVNESSLNVSVCVRVSGQRARNHVVRVQTRDITATAPADYTAINIILEFPPGMDLRCTDIEIVDDVLRESRELFAVILSSSDQSVNILKPFGVIEIIDTSDPVIIAFQQPSYAFSEATPSVTVSVDVSNVPLGIEVTVYLSTVDGSAEAGQDYNTSMEHASFTSDGSLNVTVPIINDMLLEDLNEEFEVSVTAATNVTGVPLEIPQESISVFIVDDDVASAALVETSFEITETEASRNLAVHVCVNLMGNTAVDVSFELSTESGTAEGDEDFPEVSNVLTFPPGSGSQMECSAFAITDDSILEDEENFTIFLISNDRRIDITVDEATVAIGDDDNVFIGFAEATFTANEDDGVVTLLIDITGEASRNLIISVSTKNGSAIAGEDYVAIYSETIVLTSESLDEQLQVNITLIDNDVLERMIEMFTVCLETTDSGVTLTNDTTTVIIVEDDGPVVRFTQQVYNGTEGGNATVCLTLNGQADFNITVTLTSMNGNAMAGLDYGEINENLTFVAGEVLVCQDIALFTDDLLEVTESFIVSLSSDLPEVMIPFPTAIVDILDANVVDISFLQETYTVNEDGGIARVCINEAPTTQFEREVMATLVTRNGTAQAPMDFIAFSRDLDFSGSRIIQCVDIGSDDFPIVDDNDLEGTEVFFLDLISDDPAFGSSVETAQISIIDDDDSCGRPPNECDDNAECRPTPSGTFECMCNQGFTGNGFTCAVIEPEIMFLNNTPHVDNTTLTLTVQFYENEGVQSSICQLGRRGEQTCTGGSFVESGLPQDKITPFRLRITSTAFDGVTTVQLIRNINIGGRNTCAITVINDGQLQATYTSLNSFMVEWEGAGPVESFTCTLTESGSGNTTSSSCTPISKATCSYGTESFKWIPTCYSPFTSGELDAGNYTLAILASGSICIRQFTHNIYSLIVPNPNPNDAVCSRHPNVCDDNAECRPTSTGALQCMCNQGFTGNGFNCEVIIPEIRFFNNTPHVDNTTLTLTVQFMENEGVQSSICRLGRRSEQNCTGGSFVDSGLPRDKVTPFRLRITSTAFDGVTTVELSRNINIGGRNSCAITVINGGQLEATYTSLNSFMVEWEGAGPVESFTCVLTESGSGNTNSSSCYSPFTSGQLDAGDYSLTIQASGSMCERQMTHKLDSLIVPNPSP